MSEDKQKIIDILQELEGVWPLAFGFKKIIELTKDKHFMDLIYDVLEESIYKTKSEIEYEKKIVLHEKIKQIKKQEAYKEDMEDFLEKNLKII